MGEVNESPLQSRLLLGQGFKNSASDKKNGDAPEPLGDFVNSLLKERLFFFFVISVFLFLFLFLFSFCLYTLFFLSFLFF